MEALGRLEVAGEHLKSAGKVYRKGEDGSDAAIHLATAFRELRVVGRLMGVQWPMPDAEDDEFEKPSDGLADEAPDDEAPVDERLLLPVGAGE